MRSEILELGDFEYATEEQADDLVGAVVRRTLPRVQTAAGVRYLTPKAGTSGAGGSLLNTIQGPYMVGGDTKSDQADYTVAINITGPATSGFDLVQIDRGRDFVWEFSTLMASKFTIAGAADITGALSLAMVYFEDTNFKRALMNAPVPIMHRFDVRDTKPTGYPFPITFYKRPRIIKGGTSMRITISNLILAQGDTLTLQATLGGYDIQ